MANRFRLAIIGCGKISASHVEAALASPTTDLVALVDPARERGVALAERFGIQPTLAASVAELDGAIDGAVIATPNHTHAELAEQCLAAGVSVLIEKPLALTSQEGARVCDAARRAGRTVAVGYVSRFRESVALMADLIRDGYFGRIHRFAYQFGTRGGWAPLSAYNLDRRTSGGGVLVTTGTHFVDRMLHWFGYPDEAYLVDDSKGGPEANAVLHVQYGGRQGFAGTARFSKAMALPAGFVMETAGGIVVLTDRSDSSIVCYPDGRPDLQTVVSRRSTSPGDEFVNQLEDFVAASRTAQPPRVTGEQGLESLRLIEQLYANRRPMVTGWYTGLDVEASA